GGWGGAWVGCGRRKWWACGGTGGAAASGSAGSAQVAPDLARASVAATPASPEDASELYSEPGTSSAGCSCESRPPFSAYRTFARTFISSSTARSLPRLGPSLPYFSSQN